MHKRMLHNFSLFKFLIMKEFDYKEKHQIISTEICTLTLCSRHEYFVMILLLPLSISFLSLFPRGKHYIIPMCFFILLLHKHLLIVNMQHYFMCYLHIHIWSHTIYYNSFFIVLNIMLLKFI